MDRLREMELLVGAIREGSFSAAGRRIGLSPASVSRHIGELEARLGTQLVIRTSRRLSLTEAGREYLARAELILQGVRDADAAARALHQAPKGTLRVHSRMLFGMTVVVPLIPTFQRLYPELRVELRLSERATVLNDDEFDVDLRIDPPQSPSLMQRKLLATEPILVASPDYLAQMPTLRVPADIEDHRCLTYWLGPDDPVWRFLAGGRLIEIPVPSPFCTDNGLVLRNLAVAGHGIALLDDYTVATELGTGLVTRLLPTWRVTNTTFDRAIFAAFRQTSHPPAKIRAFLDFLAAQLSAARPAGQAGARS